MARRSNKSITEIVTPSPTTNVSFIVDGSIDNNDPLALLERKITLATEGLLHTSFVNWY
jgi:hypothetical protein